MVFLLYFSEKGCSKKMKNEMKMDEIKMQACVEMLYHNTHEVYNEWEFDSIRRQTLRDPLNEMAWLLRIQPPIVISKTLMRMAEFLLALRYDVTKLFVRVREQSDDKTSYILSNIDDKTDCAIICVRDTDDFDVSVQFLYKSYHQVGFVC